MIDNRLRHISAFPSADTEKYGVVYLVRTVASDGGEPEIGFWEAPGHYGYIIATRNDDGTWSGRFRPGTLGGALLSAGCTALKYEDTSTSD